MNDMYWGQGSMMKMRRNEGTNSTTMMRRSNVLSRTTVVTRRRDGVSRTMTKAYNWSSAGWNETENRKKSKGRNM
jgi:hypothetical protein